MPQEPAPAELSAEGIAKIKADFIATARRAQAIGIDAIELHGAHAYLIDEFFWSVTNQRTDRFGGAALEQRAEGVVDRAARHLLGDVDQLVVGDEEQERRGVAFFGAGLIVRRLGRAGGGDHRPG